MPKRGLMLGLIVVLSLIMGCEALKTEADKGLFDSIAELRQQIEQEEWDDTLSHINLFKESYEQRKWKLQLLGDLDDYKGIELELVSLEESAKDKNKLETLIALMEIKQRLEIIYNL